MYNIEKVARAILSKEKRFDKNLVQEISKLDKNLINETFSYDLAVEYIGIDNFAHVLFEALILNLKSIYGAKKKQAPVSHLLAQQKNIINVIDSLKDNISFSGEKFYFLGNNNSTVAKPLMLGIETNVNFKEVLAYVLINESLDDSNVDNIIKIMEKSKEMITLNLLKKFSTPQHFENRWKVIFDSANYNSMDLQAIPTVRYDYIKAVTIRNKVISNSFFINYVNYQKDKDISDEFKEEILKNLIFVDILNSDYFQNLNSSEQQKFKDSLDTLFPVEKRDRFLNRIEVRSFFRSKTLRYIADYPTHKIASSVFITNVLDFIKNDDVIVFNNKDLAECMISFNSDLLPENKFQFLQNLAQMYKEELSEENWHFLRNNYPASSTLYDFINKLYEQNKISKDIENIQLKPSSKLKL